MMLMLLGIAAITMLLSLLGLHRIWRSPVPIYAQRPPVEARVARTRPSIHQRAFPKRKSKSMESRRRKEGTARMTVRSVNDSAA